MKNCSFILHESAFVTRMHLTCLLGIGNYSHYVSYEWILYASFRENLFYCWRHSLTLLKASDCWQLECHSRTCLDYVPAPLKTLNHYRSYLYNIHYNRLHHNIEYHYSTHHNNTHHYSSLHCTPATTAPTTTPLPLQHPPLHPYHYRPPHYTPTTTPPPLQLPPLHPHKSSASPTAEWVPLSCTELGPKLPLTWINSASSCLWDYLYMYIYKYDN